MKGHKRVFKQTTGDAIGGAGLSVGGDLNGNIGGGFLGGNVSFTGGNATSGSNSR
jgi:hypothetical protein